jgi:site-specific recombinase XerD
MRSEQKVALLIWHWTSKSRKKDGKAPIYIRITIEGKEEEISTGMVVHPDYWDGQNKRCLPGPQDCEEINNQLTEAVADIEAHFRVLKKKYDQVTTTMLKNVFNGRPELYDRSANNGPRKNMHTLLEAANLVIKNFGEQVDEGLRSEETLKQWRATRNKIKEYAYFQFKTNDISLDSVTNLFADEVYAYLTIRRKRFLYDPKTRIAISDLDNTEGIGQIRFNKMEIVNLNEAAACKQIKNIKHILKQVTKLKWIVTNPIEDYQSSNGDKEVVPLEMNEIMAIYEKKIEVKRLDEVRDAYLFQIFTGFAFQEIYNLSRENVIKVGIQGEPWLVRRRGKTKVEEMVPILPIVSKLIEKYKDHPYCKGNNKLLPVNRNGVYNCYLKEIADLCGINRNLKTHLARHTFADIMLNVCNVPLEDVSKMLGHKSTKTTMRYCRVRKARISQNMNKASGILFDGQGILKKIA